MPLVIFENHSFDIQLLQFEDDQTTPKSFSGTYRAIICKDADRDKPLLAFTEGNGILKSGNEMIISCSKANNKLKQGDYFLDLRNDTSSTRSYPVLQLSLNVQPAAK